MQPHQNFDAALFFGCLTSGVELLRELAKIFNFTRSPFVPFLEMPSMVPTSLKQWWQRLVSKPARRASRRKPDVISVRPWLEALEDRIAPAIYTVDTLGDAGSSTGPQSGDLRYCIATANADAVADTIVFSTSLSSRNIDLTNTGALDQTY